MKGAFTTFNVGQSDDGAEWNKLQFSADGKQVSLELSLYSKFVIQDTCSVNIKGSKLKNRLLDYLINKL